MSNGNKHDNGVHEVGKLETLQAYQEDTPGQQVEKYLESINEVIEKKKEKQKKSFMQVFQNPLKGFPYNEELDDNFVKPLDETIKEAQTYKSIIQGLEKDKKEISKKSKAFGQNDTKFVDKAINFLKMLEKEGIPSGQISQVDFVTNRVPKFFVGNPNKSPSFSKFTPNDVKKAVAHAKKMGIMESVDLQEGTWAVPDSYPKLVKLNGFLKQKANFKDAQSVHRWHVQADNYFGDDSFSDDIDAYKTTLKGGERSFYDKGSLHGQEYLDRMKKYNKIKAGTDLRDVLEKQLSDWTGGVLKFKNHEIVQMPRDWYMKDNPNEKDDKSPVKAKLESVDYHTNVIVEKFKRGKGRLKFKKSPPIKVEGNAVSRAQQAAIAIAKKKKNESIMDSYRQMWESENLEEKKEFKQKDIDIVAKLTDRNEHTLSLMHIAKAVGDRKAGKKLELISKLHMEYGSMTKDLMNMRNEIYDNLKKEMMKDSNGKDMYNAT